MEKKRFAVAASASRGRYTAHAVFMVEAVSRDEADGIGMRICHKTWPPADRFTNHFVCSCADDNVVTVESAVWDGHVPAE